MNRSNSAFATWVGVGMVSLAVTSTGVGTVGICYYLVCKDCCEIAMNAPGPRYTCPEGDGSLCGWEPADGNMGSVPSAFSFNDIPANSPAGWSHRDPILSGFCTWFPQSCNDQHNCITDQDHPRVTYCSVDSLSGVKCGHGISPPQSLNCSPPL